MRTKYSIKNSIVSVITNIFTFIFAFINQTFFIKILGIDYAGLNGLFSNVLIILNLLEFGFGDAILFYLYRSIAKDDKEKIKSLMLFCKKIYHVIIFLVLIIGLLISPFIKYLIKEVSVDINIYYVYLLFLLTTVSGYVITYKRNLIYAYQRNYILKIIHIFYIVIMNIAQLLVLLLTKNYYLYLIIKIVCIFIESIVANIKINKDYPFIMDKKVKELDISIKKDIKEKVESVFVHKIAYVVTNSTDNIVISIFLGLRYVGLYSNYYYIISSVQRLFNNIIVSSAASVGNLLVEKDYDKRYEVFNKISFLNYWFNVVTSVCLLCLFNPFIKIWLGSDYLLPMSVVIVLVINHFEFSSRTTFLMFKNSAGIFKEDRLIPVIQSILNIIFSIILVNYIGIAGVFIATFISSLVLWNYTYPVLVFKRLFNVDKKDYYFRLVFNIIIASLIIYISYSVITLISFNNLIIEFIIKAIVGFMISNIMMLLVFNKNKNFIYYVDLVKNKIKK